MSFQHLSNPSTSQQPLAGPLSQPNSQSWEVVVDPDATLSQPESQSTQPRAQSATGRSAEPQSQLQGSQQPRNHAQTSTSRNAIGVKKPTETKDDVEPKESEQQIAARYNRVGIKRRPKPDNRLRFKALIGRINRRQWNMLPDSIHGKLTYNGHQMTLYEFTQHLRQEFPPKTNITLEIVSILGGKIPASGEVVDGADDGGGPVGARLGVTVVILDGMMLPGTSRSTIQYTRHMFAYFTKGKLSELSDISDESGKLRHGSSITPVPGLRPPPPPASIDLRTFYQDYITTINSTKGGPEVGAFCKPSGVVWNGSQKSVQDYCLLMRNAFDAIPDLKFNTHAVLVDEELQQIAVRIDCSGTPVKPFGGGIPNGQPVAFSEHAFYWLEQGKISDVLTVVDWENYRAQLVC